MLLNSYRNKRGRVRTVGRESHRRMLAGLPPVGVSLLKRRRWFADDDDDGDDDDGQDDPKYNPKDLEEAKKIIASLVKRLDERDATVDALKDGQDTLEQRIQAMEKAARKRSEEDGDYKKLYEETLAEMEKLKPEVERGKTAIETIRSSNETRVAKIPEERRMAVPVDYAPEKLQTWLNQNEGWLIREPAPGYDGGKGGNGESPKPKLTPEEIEAGKLMGLSEEDLLKAKGNESS